LSRLTRHLAVYIAYCVVAATTMLVSTAAWAQEGGGKGERVKVDGGLSSGGQVALMIFIILGIAVAVVAFLLWSNNRGRRHRVSTRTGIRRY